MKVSPLPEDQWDDTVNAALSRMLPADRRNPTAAGNALATLVRHPALTKAFLGFNVHLLFGSTLEPRLRELAILRVAHQRGCEYEWHHHARMGAAAGLTEGDIAAARGEAAADDDFDRLLLRAVDELGEKSALSDETWAALGERLDERQRMDLVFTVGGYTTLAMAFNTFGVQVEH
ncbi:carboxymuconolactone decarboxylase family protein [Nocardia gamkensis]|jgi:4-carboxymuconolactone decarboxylase|uniref:Carboxymuconolactone decarboxylase family protein n=1 Tax=Nocardia gamkensis TaxID=352869 RepID=A0A7X6KZN4_9NOCA|nr:carboxymuconolactone decarboxylase family protein [Nocardia gamkensis]NKY25155.1 carboxymuconolactone decarboxylase family protein [Nocardia gamkensis]NQE70148.1 4-carboxymuconolactone decarboxylase [Nocardia gamkensis]